MTPTLDSWGENPLDTFRRHYEQFFKDFGIKHYREDYDKMWLDGVNPVHSCWLTFESFSDMKKFVAHVGYNRNNFLPMLEKRL